MSGSNLIRWAGLSAVVAGVLFVGTQLTHPPNDPSSVATSSWAITHYFSLGFSVFGLLGIYGIYARQVEEAGLLGLVGFLMYFLLLVLLATLIFFEAFLWPLLVTEAPQFTAGFFAVIAGGSGPGALGPIWLLQGFLYIIGGSLFGISIIRAGILPRWAAIVFTIGAASGVVGVLSEAVGRIGAVALGLGLAWLGYALWSEKPAPEKTDLNKASAVPG